MKVASSTQILKFSGELIISYKLCPYDKRETELTCHNEDRGQDTSIAHAYEDFLHPAVLNA